MQPPTPPQPPTAPHSPVPAQSPTPSLPESCRLSQSTPPTVPAPPTEPAPPTGGTARRWIPYATSAGLTAVVLTLMMRLWQADLSVPFWYSGGALANAGYFKNVLTTGWYDYQPDLGVPFGQRYAYPTSPGDLHAVVIKLLGLFTHDWAVAFNVFFLLGFLLAAVAAVPFFRACGLSPVVVVVLSVLFAVAPYHFLHNESQIFLSAYSTVPLIMLLVVRAMRAEPLWGRRLHVHPVLAALTGRGAGTAAILALVAYSGGDYLLFAVLLLITGGLAGFIRSRTVRPLGGTCVALAVLAGASLLAAAPALARSSWAGGAPTGPSTPGSETYAMKFAALVLPPPGEPLPFLASFRAAYDSGYPLPGETPALGLVAAFGLLVIMGVALTALTGRYRTSEPSPDRVHRIRLLNEMTVLGLVIFCLGVLGGPGTIISLLAGGFSGWGRISIVLALPALAASGLVLERVVGRIRASSSTGGRPTVGRFARGALPALAVLVLLIGAGDQSLTGAVPDYRANAAGSASDRQFVQGIERREPAGSMIFQLPWVPFTHSGAADAPATGAQLALWLQSSQLRFSAGGIAGPVQTDWPTHLVQSAPTTLVHYLAAIGFVGVTIDRASLPDGGRQWTDALVPLLGQPLLTSPDGRYVYLSLGRAIAALDARTTVAQRARIAEGLTKVAP